MLLSPQLPLLLSLWFCSYSLTLCVRFIAMPITRLQASLHRPWVTPDCRSIQETPDPEQALDSVRDIPTASGYCYSWCCSIRQPPVCVGADPP